ncbi:uncharacterized protein ARMOST_20172 [Armillaria ostoyae]|uniref:Ribosome recycling factor domain-containing protein n=1 Tax=Armillaria ostoyae TaxID=47428 RepID=A0A284S6L8_ARMOS|nr:uncharacterized protein ARMOST_20172 [Armillaria ostoyae]
MSPWASDYRMRSKEESSEQYYPSLRAAYLAHTTTSVFSFVRFGLKWLYAGRLQSNSLSHKVTFVNSGSVGRAQFLHTILNFVMAVFQLRRRSRLLHHQKQRLIRRSSKDAVHHHPTMQVLFRSCLSLSRCLLLRPPNSPLRSPSLRLPARGRNYAKEARSTSSLKPGSQQPLTKPADIAEHEKCEEKMKSSVEWLRRDCADASARAAGRVTPALLANVRVKEQRLEEVATVGVRDGSMLVVTAFDEENLKHVEAAIYDTKIPLYHTSEAGYANIENPWKKAEDARVQYRKLHQASVKKGKYEKRSIELEVFQDLIDKHIADIDKIVADMKTLGLSR